MFKKILLSLSLIFIISSISFANQPIYQLDEDYTAVRNDIFDQLVENDRLVDLLQEELDYVKTTIQQLKDLHSQNDNLYEKRILIFKDTLELKDSIIEYKDDQISDYKELYSIKSAEVNKYKFESFIDKVLLLGLGVFAVNNIDDTSAKTGVSALTLYLLLN